MVESVLGELGAGQLPRLTVFNKADLPAPPGGRTAVRRTDRAPSRRAPAPGSPQLLRQIGTLLAAQQERLQVLIPVDRGDLLAQIHQAGRVAEQRLHDGAFQVTAYVPPKVAGRIRKALRMGLREPVSQ